MVLYKFHQRAFHDRCMRTFRLTLDDFSQIDIFAIKVMAAIHILTTAHSFQLYIFIVHTTYNLIPVSFFFFERLRRKLTCAILKHKNIIAFFIFYFVLN